MNTEAKYFLVIILMITINLGVSCSPNQSNPGYVFIEATAEGKDIDYSVLVLEVPKTPMIYPTPNPGIIKRDDLGISVSEVIEYFEKSGWDFEIIKRSNTNEVLYIGSYQEAYFLYLDSVNQQAKSVSMDIWIDFTKLDEYAPGLGDLPIALYGQDFYNKTVSPWLLSLPENKDTLCLDGIVFQYNNFANSRAQENRISLRIYTEADCNWIDGCCPIKH